VQGQGYFVSPKEKNVASHRVSNLKFCFLTRDILLLRYQMALVVESGCFEKVLWHQVSHLLLKYTKSGYETVLTADCARQGRSATE
jgi:hypothetical protein